MELRNDFHVAMPAAMAWLVLSDVERIAPCFPGAQLQEIEGDEYRGIVKVKVGPITAQYKGRATWVEQDQAGGRVVLRAEGRDTGGGGNANATITATLTPDGEGTQVQVVTELAITGRLAQFGRSMLGDVSTKLLQQFADCLEHQVLAGNGPAAPVPAAPAPTPDSGAAPEAAPESRAPTVRRLDGPDVPPADLLEAARASVAKRALPALAGLSALVLLILAWRRRQQR